MIDVKKLQAEKTQLREIWDVLEIDSDYPTKNIPLWLIDYGFEEIVAAFKHLADMMARPDREIVDPAKYVGKILRNSKLENMTVEERAEKISAMRSAVGSLGARKKHEAELAKIRQEFATVSQTLPGNAVDLDLGFGVGSDLVLISDVGGDTNTLTDDGFDGTSKPAAATPPVVSTPSKQRQDQNQNQNQNQHQDQKPNDNFGEVDWSPVASATAKSRATPTPSRVRQCKTCNRILVRNQKHVCPGLPRCPECLEQANPADHVCAGEP